jgi:GNAT superfamily N-acetyltransferase
MAKKTAKKRAGGSRRRAEKAPRSTLEFYPLTAERWSDLVELFGERGAYGGCWCMWWRLSRAEFRDGQGARNREALQSLVESGEVPGILAYEGNVPVGWCAVAPRESFPSIGRSRVLRPIDERPAWSIVCLFVDRRHRGKGVAAALVEAAVGWARGRGADLVEAYPTETRGRTLPPVSSFMGTPELFEGAGFDVCAAPSPSRRIVRRELREPSEREMEL